MNINLDLMQVILMFIMISLKLWELLKNGNNRKNK